MHQEDTSPDGIAGLPQDEAVEVVVARIGADPESARSTLNRVTEDGVVRLSAVEDELAQVSKVVTTPETRAELAAMELSEAREEAEHVADLDIVRSRLKEFESRLETIESRVIELSDDLGTLVDRSGDSCAVYEVTRGIERLTAEANDVHRAADELLMDIEDFERWVVDPSRRVGEFEEEVAAVEDGFEDLGGTLDKLGKAPDDPGLTWADATFRHRVIALLLADLRAEFEDLRTWADRVGGDEPSSTIEDRLDALGRRRTTLDERIDDLARPTWTDRFGQQLAELETALADHEPPVDWGAVQATFETHRLEPEPRA